MGYLKKERRYRISWYQGPRGGYVVLLHDTAHCWITVKEFHTGNKKSLYSCQKLAQDLADRWNAEDEALDRVVSENPGFVDS